MSDKQLYEQTIAEIDCIYTRTNQDIFRHWFGDFAKWKIDLESAPARRNVVLEQIEENALGSKISASVRLMA